MRGTGAEACGSEAGFPRTRGVSAAAGAERLAWAADNLLGGTRRFARILAVPGAGGPRGAGFARVGAAAPGGERPTWPPGVGRPLRRLLATDCALGPAAAADRRCAPGRVPGGHGQSLKGRLPGACGVPAAAGAGRARRRAAGIGGISRAIRYFFIDKTRALNKVGGSRGLLAQLGERLNGIQEVKSSILFSSTKQVGGQTGRSDPFFV